MRTVLVCIALLALLAFPVASRAAVLVLEPWTESFPPNPCLPASGQRVLFTNLYCDGVSCPPGLVVGPCWPGSQARQAGIPSVRPTIERVIDLTGGDPAEPPISRRARIVPEQQVIEFDCAEPECQGGLNIRYWMAPEWGLDPVALGATELRVHVDGDITPSHPLSCYVLFEDVGDTEEEYDRFANATVVISAPGEFVFPFSSFQRDPADFDLSHLEWIVVQFYSGNCSPEGCPTRIGPSHFTAGPIRFEVSGPVAGRRSSWGQLKARYR